MVIIWAIISTTGSASKGNITDYQKFSMSIGSGRMLRYYSGSFFKLHSNMQKHTVYKKCTKDFKITRINIIYKYCREVSCGLDSVIMSEFLTGFYDELTVNRILHWKLQSATFQEKVHLTWKDWTKSNGMNYFPCQRTFGSTNCPQLKNTLAII